MLSSPAHGHADLALCARCGAHTKVPAAALAVPRCGQCDAVLPWLTTAGDDDFDSVVVDSRVPVLLDLWAPWWPPLTLVEPGVPHVAETFAGSLKAVQVNAATAPGVVH